MGRHFWGLILFTDTSKIMASVLFHGLILLLAIQSSMANYSDDGGDPNGELILESDDYGDMSSGHAGLIQEFVDKRRFFTGGNKGIFKNFIQRKNFMQSLEKQYKRMAEESDRNQ